MRRRIYTSGSSDSKGCAIFIVILVFLPVIGFIFKILNWIVNHIFWVLFGMGVIFLISWIIAALEDSVEETDI